MAPATRISSILVINVPTHSSVSSERARFQLVNLQGTPPNILIFSYSWIHIISLLTFDNSIESFNANIYHLDLFDEIYTPMFKAPNRNISLLK